MADEFRAMFEGLKQTAEGLILANEGIKRSVEAALRVQEEHGDLKETVGRLEALVLQLLQRLKDQDGQS